MPPAAAPRAPGPGLPPSPGLKERLGAGGGGGAGEGTQRRNGLIWGLIEGLGGLAARA